MWCPRMRRGSAAEVPDRGLFVYVARYGYRPGNVQRLNVHNHDTIADPHG
jgi:hypothetical protein